MLRAVASRGRSFLLRCSCGGGVTRGGCAAGDRGGAGALGASWKIAGEFYSKLPVTDPPIPHPPAPGAGPSQGLQVWCDPTRCCSRAERGSEDAFAFANSYQLSLSFVLEPGEAPRGWKHPLAPPRLGRISHMSIMPFTSGGTPSSGAGECSIWGTAHPAQIIGLFQHQYCLSFPAVAEVFSVRLSV